MKGLREGIQGRDSGRGFSTAYLFGVWCRRGTKYENREEMHLTFKFLSFSNTVQVAVIYFYLLFATLFITGNLNFFLIIWQVSEELISALQT